MQITAIFAVAENTFYKGTQENDKSVRSLCLIFRNLNFKYFWECVQPCVFDAPKCTKVLERTAKKCGVRIIFRNLCLNISENACSRAFLTPRSVRRYSRGRQKSVGCALSLETFAKYFRECVQPCVFDAPKCTKVLERAAKKCGVCVIFRNLC